MVRMRENKSGDERKGKPRVFVHIAVDGAKFSAKCGPHCARSTEVI